MDLSQKTVLLRLRIAVYPGGKVQKNKKMSSDSKGEKDKVHPTSRTQKYKNISEYLKVQDRRQDRFRRCTWKRTRVSHNLLPCKTI